MCQNTSTTYQFKVTSLGRHTLNCKIQSFKTSISCRLCSPSSSSASNLRCKSPMVSFNLSIWSFNTLPSFLTSPLDFSRFFIRSCWNKEHSDASDHFSSSVVIWIVSNYYYDWISLKWLVHAVALSQLVCILYQVGLFLLSFCLVFGRTEHSYLWSNLKFINWGICILFHVFLLMD